MHARVQPLPPDTGVDDVGSDGVAGRLYDALTREILNGELRAGEKLSEPVISARFGVSRAPVREAIRRMQERGLVSYTARRGARVAQPSVDEYLALLDVREAMECMAARLAAQHMGDADVSRLRDLVARHQRQIDSSQSGAYPQQDLETDFHVCLARGSANPILAALLCEQFYPRLQLCRRLHRGVPGRGIEAWREHVRIVEAIAQHDGELAEMLMRRHVTTARAALRKALGVPERESQPGA